MQDDFPAGAFDREDESPDAIFYRDPRLVTHIDEGAIAAVGEAYRRFLTPGGDFLDLMSSWVSHFPPDFDIGHLVGLGMNEVELRANPRLDEHVVQDLNFNPRLPYADDRFDGAVICVSIQYLTRPVEVFREIARVLKPGAPLIVTYSNRCFPTKAVRIWLALDDARHGLLIGRYAAIAGGFEPAEVHDMTPLPLEGGYADPLYAVVARKLS